MGDLATRAGISLADSDFALLQILTEAIVWHGRYPVPVPVPVPKAQRAFGKLWELIDKHLFDRVPLGRVSVLTPNGALSWDGFDNLWRTASAAFWQHYEPT